MKRGIYGVFEKAKARICQYICTVCLQHILDYPMTVKRTEKGPGILTWIFPVHICTLYLWYNKHYCDKQNGQFCFYIITYHKNLSIQI